MASVRVTGFKGVGFITPDDGSEDLFVHQAGNVPTAATAVGATAAVAAYAAYAATGEEATAATGEAATAAAVAEVSPATSAARRATWQGAAPREAAAAVAASATSATRRATSPATAPTGARRCATVASDPTEPHVGSRPPSYLSKDLKNELEELSKWVSDDEYSSSLLEQINIDNLDVDDLCSNGRDVCLLAKLNEMGDGTIRRTLNNRSWKEKRSVPGKLVTRKIFHYLKDGKRVKEVAMNEYSLAGGPKDKVLCHIILSRQVASSPSEENTDGMMLRSRRLPRNEVRPLAGHKAMPGRSLLVALKNSEANGGMPSVSADGCGGTAGESNNNFKVSQQEAIRVKEELRKEVACLRVELKQVTNDRDHSVIQLNRLNIEYGNSKEQIGKTSEECERFRTKVSELEETCNAQQQQIQTFQKQLAVATEKLKLADVTAIEAMKGYEEQKEKIKYLEERLAQAESHILEGDELRKKLHNTILELKGNIRVFCRVRPLLPSDGDSNGPEGASISFPTSVESAGRGIDLINQGQKLSFSYDKVFAHDASQEDVFLEISQLVQSALDGYKVCIFAYGQSGSGKTYTMMGKPGIDQKGIIPRSLEQIFKASRFLESQGCNYSMHASMLEIYNETIRDLLAPKKYNVKHDHHGNMNVAQRTFIQVFGISDVTKLLEKALESRSVGKTQMNEQSSRSHFVFTLKLSGANKKTGQLVEGVLNLIDLAGNEAFGEGGSTGDRLKETQSINKSLSALSDVICAIATRANHVPFRNSKLTFLLQPYLEGDSKALMLVHISPEASSIDKTIRSLRFAERVNACEIGKPRRQTKARPND